MWFKNFRAKRKQNSSSSEKAIRSPATANYLIDKSNKSFQKHMDINGPHLVSLVFTNQLILSFQSSIDPKFKVPKECSVECKTVYLGCCQDPNI